MIGIIGGGASGLLLSRLCEMYKIEYVLFEKRALGKKIMASGNGRCNIANVNLKREFYNNELGYKVVSENQARLFDLFKALHIYTYHDDEGRMYPISESSQSVFDILSDGVTSIVYEEVVSIKKNGSKYIINDKYVGFDKIVISTGSMASLTNDKKTDIIDYLGIKRTALNPSLVGFKVNESIKAISGVRQKCMARLYNNDRLVHSEYGEVIFKDDGISGIVIMNMSSYYNRLKNKNGSYITLDLLGDMNYQDLRSVLKPKLLDYIKSHKLDARGFRLNIKDTYDFKAAQVVSGGVEIDMIDETLALRKDKNIFIAGEALDVDGVCGGYNLMFAFTSAIKIFDSIYEVSNK